MITPCHLYKLSPSGPALLAPPVLEALEAGRLRAVRAVRARAGVTLYALGAKSG